MILSRPLRNILGVVVIAVTTLHAHAQRMENVFTPYQKRTEEAVQRGLDFLVGLQSEDGHFLGDHGQTTGIVSLIGMAMLSQGTMPGQGRHGEALVRCIDYVLKFQQKDGMIVRDRGHEKMYSHSISTLFLSEVSGMVDLERQKKIDDILPKALRLILEAQKMPKDDNHKGGWRYQPDSRDSDLSCSGWALMALRSARLNGAAVPDEAIQNAVSYVRRRHKESTGEFGYTGNSDHSVSLTGMAVLCLELCGYHDDPMTRKAASFILGSFKRLVGDQFETYGNYYNAQAMFQVGGEAWKLYAEWMYEHYLAQQREDGSWRGPRDGNLYNTSLMVLALTVPYRQLPIYQRDETVDD